MNLVVVSNRVARAKANEPMTGGLAAALLPVVEQSGAIWVGSSGRLSPRAHGPVNMEVQALGAGALALLDMPANDYNAYYEGFANSALWPALHSRSDLIRASDDDYGAYRRINAFMAHALLRFRKDNTAFWIQDYHFLALAEELRRLGVTQPIGFFLHTPWPACSVAVGVPHHRELIEAMLAYDVIGFQTEDDCKHFADYLREELGLEVEDGMVRSRHGLSRIAVFPIGIDVDGFAAQAAKAATHPDVSRLRLSLRGEKLAIGVDRVDYSKGLVNRINAFDRLLTNNPVAEAGGLAIADRNALARRDRGLQPPAGGPRRPRDQRQRASRRGGLDADPLPQQGIRSAGAVGVLSFGAGRRGDAAA